MQGSDGLQVPAEFLFQSSLAQVIVRNAEIRWAGDRLGLFRAVNRQTFHDYIKGQAVFVTGIDGGWSRRWPLRLRLLGEQVGVALIVAHSILEKVLGNGLVAPGIRAGMNENI